MVTIPIRKYKVLDDGSVGQRSDGIDWQSFVDVAAAGSSLPTGQPFLPE